MQFFNIFIGIINQDYRPLSQVFCENKYWWGTILFQNEHWDFMTRWVLKVCSCMNTGFGIEIKNYLFDFHYEYLEQ